jgi:propionyl-CoA carboxylase alpha chain
MGAQAVALAKAVNYDSAGTVEFVAGQDKSFFFLEMNTRLQVEHPVTELITGVDLVEQMIRSAYGEKLPFAQKDLKIDGWAMESRIYAEDPYRGFLPSIGRLVRYDPPVEGDVANASGGGKVRNDAGVREGDEISMFYDPMISKLSTWAKTRDGAIDVMGRALEDFHIEGLGQNIPFLSAVMDQPRFRSGKLSTNYIKDEFPEGFLGLPPSDAQRDLIAAVALSMHRTLLARAAPDQLRQDWIVVVGHEQREARVSGNGGGLMIETGGKKLHLEDVRWRPGQPTFRASLDGREFTVAVKPAAEGFVVRHRAAVSHVLVLTPRSADLHGKLPPKKAADTSKMVLSPMPGLVVTLDVTVGQEVRAGEAVAVIEAMKMQNIIRAERDGTVKAVNAAAGDSVAADEVLVEFA